MGWREFLSDRSLGDEPAPPAGLPWAELQRNAAGVRMKLFHCANCSSTAYNVHNGLWLQEVKPECEMSVYREWSGYV